MKKIIIFLASSVELKEEREQFELEIRRKINTLIDNDIFLQLEIWEDAPSYFSQDRKQNDYNKLVQSADIFVLLAKTKIGEYTKEEFEAAYKIFKSTNNKHIFVFLKNTKEVVEESLELFKNRLKELSQYGRYFEDSGELWILFNKDLDKLIDSKSVGNTDKLFNEVLTKRLFEAINNHDNKRHESLFKDTQEKGSDWENNVELIKSVNNLIIDDFVGVLGTKIENLISIGKFPADDDKNRRYINDCIILTQRALQLICFSLFSALWDYKKNNKYDFTKFTKPQPDSLRKFFEREYEAGINYYCKLLTDLCNIFFEQEFEFPLENEAVFSDLVKENGKFITACNKLYDIRNSVGRNGYPILKCFEAEEQVTIILENLIFLVDYKMVSIRSIIYDEERFKPPNFLHSYADLGSIEGIERVNYVKNPINTFSILFYKKNYLDGGINLSPFAIDLNGLKFEANANVCFFSHKVIKKIGQTDKEFLKYIFLVGAGEKDIEFKKTIIANIDINDLNELMKDPKKRIQNNLDTVFLQFQDAQKTLLL